MITMTWLEVATLEEQGLLGRPRQRARWTPSDDDDDDDDNDDDDDDRGGGGGEEVMETMINTLKIMR